MMSKKISEKRTIPDIMSGWCAQQPNALLATDANGAISYAQTAEKADQFAAALLGAQVQPGDRVCVLAAPGINFLISFLGTVKIGAIWVGLNPKYTAREVKHVLTDTNASIIFVEPGKRGQDFANMFNELNTNIDIYSFSDKSFGVFKPYETFTSKAKPYTPIDIDPDLPACIIYTSGTTGAPKGALISHHALTKTSAIQNTLLKEKHPRILNNLPINHIGCLGDLTMYALTGGGFIAFQEKFSAEGSLDLIEKHKLTVWLQIPTMFQLSLNVLKEKQYDLSSLKTIVFSGSPASPALLAELRSITPNVVNAYGMTETVGSITWAINCDDTALANTIGSPVPEYDVRIASPEGENIQQGEVGEIQVSGDFHMQTYWENSEATKEAFTHDGWLKTGDLAAENPDGSYSLTGRIKEMFKSGGYNVYPLEIEQVLEQIPDLKKAIVVPVDDALYNEVGFAFIHTTNTSLLEGDTLKQHCTQHLANYKIPKNFVHVKELPYLPNGKLDKGALKERAQLALAG